MEVYKSMLMARRGSLQLYYTPTDGNLVGGEDNGGDAESLEGSRGTGGGRPSAARVPEVGP
jgi:hypothetical protein